jgi:hypothetical protein
VAQAEAMASGAYGTSTARSLRGGGGGGTATAAGGGAAQEVDDEAGRHVPPASLQLPRGAEWRRVYVRAKHASGATALTRKMQAVSISSRTGVSSCCIFVHGTGAAADASIVELGCSIGCSFCISLVPNYALSQMKAVECTNAPKFVWPVLAVVARTLPGNATPRLPSHAQTTTLAFLPSS